MNNRVDTAAGEEQPLAATSPAAESWFRLVWADFAASRAAVAALGFCVIMLTAALLAPLVAPQNPYDLMEISMFDARLAPGTTNAEGFRFLLGTDGQGRDMLSAMLYGLRTSLFVGVLSGIIAIAVGVALGLIAAYAGGPIDTAIMRVVDFMLGFPTILVALMLLAVLGQGVDKVIFALVMVQWAYFARAVRGTALSNAARNMSKRQSRSTSATPASSSATCCPIACRRSSSSAPCRWPAPSLPKRR